MQGENAFASVRFGSARCWQYGAVKNQPYLAAYSPNCRSVKPAASTPAEGDEEQEESSEETNAPEHRLGVHSNSSHSNSRF